MAEEILEIANSRVDGKETVVRGNADGKKTVEVKTADMLDHRRLQIETRKWLMAKMKPKRYGDKLDVTSGGDKINRGMTDEQLDAILTRATTAGDKASENTQA